MNVGGDHDDHIGLFSYKGHHIVAIAAANEALCIPDPSYEVGKYEEDGRSGKVRVEYPFAYCAAEDLDADVKNRELPYHLFKRKSGK